jgi:hypothetical protein
MEGKRPGERLESRQNFTKRRLTVEKDNSLKIIWNSSGNYQRLLSAVRKCQMDLERKL